jgi:tetratricopeptide (TPR) repeat protein
LKQTIRLQETLVEADPLDTTARSALARSWNNLGLAHSAAKNWPAAESAYRTAIAWQEHLASSSRHAVRHCRDLAISQSNLGAALAQQGRFADASRAFEDSLTQYQAVMAKAPHDEQTKSNAGSVGHNLALTLWRQGEFERAHKVAAAALTLQASALAAVPNSIEFRARHEAQSQTVAQLSSCEKHVSSVKN